VIVIAGPTASGKTRLSFSLAQAVGGEILSADSMQVYKGLDIGTAKATPAERGLIAHHLIDVCDLSESFNVSSFYHSAQEALAMISLRDNVPIVVGGSGFYIHSLLYGPPAGPPPLPELRQQLEKQMAELGPEVLYERLQMLDPEYAKTISEFDKNKIIRALEIMALSDRRVSDFPKPNQLQEDLYDFRCWFIYYPKERLYARIEQRCDQMLAAGFLDEVRTMAAKGLKEHPSASQAIGYRQALDYLAGPETPERYDAFVLAFKRASRQYAKRQFTWFRKEPLFRWLNVDEHSPETLKEIILQDFEQND
jgi:tRNA dimethylallyltransferase